jgi:DNA repair exonuclease SbcCD nuclease subunit
MKNKVCIISDIHIGVRNDSPYFLAKQEQFFTDVFFPKLIEDDIKTVFILGDVFDRRRFINFDTLHKSKQFLFDRFENLGITVHIITGNHDCYHKSSNDVNSLDLLLHYENISIYSEPVVVDGVTLIPWINPNNYTDAMDLIASKQTDILMGHFEINGFMMHKNTISCSDGLEKSVFPKYDLILSGHFHQKSVKDNFVYVGAPTEFTWNDAECERGFHILDMDTKELEYIVNENFIHVGLVYTDKIDLLNYDFSICYDKIVQIIVAESGNKQLDLFIQKVQDSNPHDLNVIDNTTLNVMIEEGVDVDALENEDSMELIKSYIIASDSKNKELLKSTFMGLYNDSISEIKI